MPNCAEAVRDALDHALSMDQSVIVFGLGVPDPKGVFGTTLGLQEKFGHQRVFDMPASENAMTGVAIGAALNGTRPVMVHQRVDFFLLGLDQLVNNAAKWRYMFGGDRGAAITIRLIVGRGWGQGPTHSQWIHSWLANVPGLKIVIPSNPADTKGLLLSSVYSNDPVVFFEHRWIHGIEGEIPTGDYRVPLGKAAVKRQGKDITILAFSYLVPEAIRAAEAVKDVVDCEVIDLRSLNPLDQESINSSVCKTGRLLVLDPGHLTGSFASEIVSRTGKACWNELKGPPERLALPDVPVPTSPSLTRDFYPEASDIAEKILEMNGMKSIPELCEKRTPHDVPGNWFKGPF